LCPEEILQTDCCDREPFVHPYKYYLPEYERIMSDGSEEVVTMTSNSMLEDWYGLCKTSSTEGIKQHNAQGQYHVRRLPDVFIYN